METAKWLLGTHPAVDVHADDDGAFRVACLGGHLETAKWVVMLFEVVNVHCDNDFELRGAGLRGGLPGRKGVGGNSQD